MGRTCTEDDGGILWLYLEDPSQINKADHMYNLPVLWMHNFRPAFSANPAAVLVS